MNKYNSINEVITSNDYYNVMKQGLSDAQNNANKIQAQYCALHMLMIVESNQSGITFKRISNSEIDLDRNDLELIEKYINMHKMRMKTFLYNNILMSVATEIFVFIFLLKILDLNSILIGIIVLFILILDVFLNVKTSRSRFNKKDIINFEKNVDPELIEFNKNYLQ